MASWRHENKEYFDKISFSVVYITLYAPLVTTASALTVHALFGFGRIFWWFCGFGRFYLRFCGF